MPRNAVHPGEVLQEALADRKMSQAEFARRMGVTSKHVNRIVKGRAGYSTEFALGMEHVLGISASLWMNLLAEYRTNQIRHRVSAQ